MQILAMKSLLVRQIPFVGAAVFGQCVGIPGRRSTVVGDYWMTADRQQKKEETDQ